MKKPKTYHDLDYNKVVAYGDKLGLNTDTPENWKEVEQKMFAEKHGKTKNVSTDSMGEFLKGVDFPLLKKQKHSLLKVIEDIDNVKILEHLEGIVNLINQIQDEAVDKYGYKESTVFKLSKDK